MKSTLPLGRLGLGLALPWLVAATCAVAQPVWRCGADARSFSDRPCADGQPLQMAALADERSAAQREQARQVAAREQRLADSLRQQRLAREQFDAVPRPRRGLGRGGAPKRPPGEFNETPAAPQPARSPASSRQAMAPRPAPAAAGTSPSAARASRRDRG